MFSVFAFLDTTPATVYYNVVKDIWTKSFIHNTYSCIEGRGIHLCANNLKRDLRKYPNETKYCLKLDIRKFYPSIPHNGLKKCIRKKIKDKDFLMILDEIIDSTDNVRNTSSKLTGKMVLEFLLVIIYLNILLIFILVNLTIYVKKNLNVSFIIVMQMI